MQYSQEQVSILEEQIEKLDQEKKELQRDKKYLVDLVLKYMRKIEGLEHDLESWKSYSDNLA